MDVFVINLKRSADRLASMERQLGQQGVPFTRVEAVDGAALSEEERKTAWSAFRWWCAIGWPVRPGEIGCALSHYGIYSQIGKPVCILEDDVEIKPGFAAALVEVGRFIDIAKPQVVLLSDLFGRRSSESGAVGIVTSRKGYCTDGYVITPVAAKALLKANLPMSTPCDHWERWARRGIIELYHHLPAVVVQRGDVYGSATNPSGFHGRNAPLLRKSLHKLKRLIGISLDNLLRVEWR